MPKPIKKTRIARTAPLRCVGCGCEIGDGDAFVPCGMISAYRRFRGVERHCISNVFALPHCPECRDAAGDSITTVYDDAAWRALAKKLRRTGHKPPRKEFCMVRWWKPHPKALAIVWVVLRCNLALRETDDHPARERARMKSKLYLHMLQEAARKGGAFSEGSEEARQGFWRRIWSAFK